MIENKKINILVVPSDTSGCSKYRSTDPHITVENNYPDEFRIDIDYQPQLDNDEWLKQYDIIQYHRTLGPYEKMESLLNRLDSLGIVTILDLDDFWSPGIHHPAYHLIKQHKIDEHIANNVKLARNLTTTTSLFADEIRKLNKNVFVISNAINTSEKQFQPNPEHSDRLRFGYLAGSSHLTDLKLVESAITKLNSNGYMDKIQMVLCGFDLRGTMTMIDETTKKQTQRPIKPTESVWYEYEKIFTDNYTTVSPEYKDFLLKFKNEEYPNVANEPYRRVWTKPISSYAANYNLFDVSLAPLEENTFNKMKSPLKCEEAGFHKKALIAQNFGPYQIDLKDANMFGGGINPMGNALLVDSAKNHKDWFKNMKKLIESPELVKQLSENLYNTVKDTYSMDKVTADRRELYLKLLEEFKIKQNEHSTILATIN
jgi:glycosyltransferase involved in cell wall biosynthesis